MGGCLEVYGEFGSAFVVFRQTRSCGIRGTGGAADRAGLAPPGVGLPRGRGRLILRESEGLITKW
jgi:hypothetical protein